jgi:hypothetical protein
MTDHFNQILPSRNFPNSNTSSIILSFLSNTNITSPIHPNDHPHSILPIVPISFHDRPHQSNSSFPELSVAFPNHPLPLSLLPQSLYRFTPPFHKRSSHSISPIVPISFRDRRNQSNSSFSKLFQLKPFPTQSEYHFTPPIHPKRSPPFNFSYRPHLLP